MTLMQKLLKEIETKNSWGKNEAKFALLDLLAQHI